MFFAPKEIKQETGESLVYNPTEPWCQKNLPLMLPTTSFTMRENANPCTATPIVCRLLSVDF